MKKTLTLFSHSDKKISLDQMIKTMDAVKLLGDIFKYNKHDISENFKKFMDIVDSLPDITEPIEDEGPEHIDKELFEI